MSKSTCNALRGGISRGRHLMGVADPKRAGWPPLLLAAFVSCAAPAWAQTPAPLPDGSGKETVQKACGSCHTLTTITNAGHDRDPATD